MNRGRRRLLGLVAPVVLLAGVLACPVVDEHEVTVSAAAWTIAVPAALDTATASGDGSGTAADVLAAVDAAAEAAGGSIEVTELDADGSVLVASAGASTPVYTASLVKLLVVHQLLLRAADGTVDLDQDDLDLMQAAIEASDDDAMDELWVEFDGDALVRAAVDTFSLTGTAPPTEAGQWGQTTTTAVDYATVLATYADTLTAADAELLTGWLQSTTSTAADGFDQSFGLLSVDDGEVAAKQGWMCCVDDTRWVHSTGVLSDGTVVVLLGTFPRSTTWAEATAALDTAADALVPGS